MVGIFYPTILLLIQIPAFGEALKSYAFRELRSGQCGNSCTLKPKVGTPFKVEYDIVGEEAAEGGISHFVNLKLNGKTFSSLKIPSPHRGRLFFYQDLFFNNHRFQIYSLPSPRHTRHISTSYHHYFIRRDNEFYYSGILPSIFYDYDEQAKPAEERFYVLVDYGRGQYVRAYYRLEESRLVESVE